MVETANRSNGSALRSHHEKELIGSIDHDLIDVREGFETLLALEDYTASQAFAQSVKAAGFDGIVYPSVRHSGETCFAAFYPDVTTVPKQVCYLSYNWDGTRIDLIKLLSFEGDRQTIFLVQS